MAPALQAHWPNVQVHQADCLPLPCTCHRPCPGVYLGSTQRDHGLYSRVDMGTSAEAQSALDLCCHSACH